MVQLERIKKLGCVVGMVGGDVNGSDSQDRCVKMIAEMEVT